MSNIDTNSTSIGKLNPIQLKGLTDFLDTTKRQNFSYTKLSSVFLEYAQYIHINRNLIDDCEKASFECYMEDINAHPMKYKDINLCIYERKCHSNKCCECIKPFYSYIDTWTHYNDKNLDEIIAKLQTNGNDFIKCCNVMINSDPSIFKYIGELHLIKNVLDNTSFYINYIKMIKDYENITQYVRSGFTKDKDNIHKYIIYDVYRTITVYTLISIRELIDAFSKYMYVNTNISK